MRPSWEKRFERYVRNNVLATQRLLEAVRQQPATALVHVSSSSVYGQAEVFPTPETAVPRPMSPYGATKLTGEHLCDLYRESFGLAVVVLRLFSVYGPRQRPDMALHRFLARGARGPPVEVYGDGSQTRDFTYVERRRRGAKGGGAARPRNGRSLQHRRRVAAPASAPSYGWWASSRASRSTSATASVLAGTFATPAADGTRARIELGFEPVTDLEQGVAAQLDWMRRALVAQEPGRSARPPSVSPARSR